MSVSISIVDLGVHGLNGLTLIFIRKPQVCLVIWVKKIAIDG